MQWWSSCLTAALELLAPERCVICGARRVDVAWANGPEGPAPGLSPWHEPHLCRPCQDRWRNGLFHGAVGDLPLYAPLPESALLVRVVGAWKYRGLRGLARPLADLLAPTLLAAARSDGSSRLVPVPLHPRRRRTRGFDQTQQLATLAGRASRIPVALDILKRRRNTAQQASRVAEGEGRRCNVADAFVARIPRRHEPRAVAVLDDLATTGATLAAAADALDIAGWDVRWCTAIGRAVRLADRPEA